MSCKANMSAEIALSCTPVLSAHCIPVCLEEVPKLLEQTVVCGTQYTSQCSGVDGTMAGETSGFTCLFQCLVVDKAGSVFWDLELALLYLFSKLPAGISAKAGRNERTHEKYDSLEQSAWA